MKKLLLLAAVIGLFSCTTKKEPALEEKTKSLIEENLKKTMHDWSSYESVEFSKLDSTFTNVLEYLNPLYKEVSKRMDVSNKFLDEAEKYIDEKNLRMAEKYQTKADSALAAAKKFKEEKTDSIIKNFKPEFNGYKMRHTYRGNNSYGAKIITTTTFYFDKDITNIIKEENKKTQNN